jgi:hypothetical protein
MLQGGAICLTVHFKPLWAKECPKFGIAHALALGLAPWLAAEVGSPLLYSVIHCVHTWTLHMCDLQCRCPPWLAQERSVLQSKQHNMQCTLLQGILLDVSIIHPRCSTYVAAAPRTWGAAATLRDRSTYKAHAGHLHHGRTFVPASVETYGHLGKPFMRYIRTLSNTASARSLAATRGSFPASARRELSMALGQSQG